MQFERVTVPAVDPAETCEWYRSRFVPETEHAGDRSAVRLGETDLEFTAAATTPPMHLAVRLLLDGEEAVGWLSERATILPVDGEPSRWFEFLNATAIYFDDPEGNVLEGLCYGSDRRRSTDSGPVGGITEVGLPARDPLALVEWLEGTVGLSAWGSPSETFAWVGDRHARFVVIPTGREWYPTRRAADLAPMSVTVAAETAHPGRHIHPRLPYEIVVAD